MKRSTLVTLRWLRRLSQAFFLAIFLLLLFRASYSSRTMDLAAETLAAPTAINRFFQFDPLLGAGLLASGRALPRLFLLSIATLAATAVLGRFFCGWVCPFGTLHHLAGSTGRGAPAARFSRLERGPSGRLKYYVLIALIIASALSLIDAGMLDPLCMLARSLTLSVFPAIHNIIKGSLLAASTSRFAFLGGPAAAIFDFLQARELLGRDVFYRAAFPTAAIFSLLLLANLAVPRFWCRHLCPLGALLGLASRLSPLKFERDESRCTRCGKCIACCGGALSPRPGPHAPIVRRAAECVLCMNCGAVCAEDALGFSFLGVRDSSDYRPDLARRGLIASVAAGLLLPPFLRAGRAGVNRSRLIRPPGALPESEFPSVCVRCGSCSRICPTDAIHSSLMEAGIEGIWTPLVVPRIGYCLFDCTLCGQICPSQALRRLTREQKTGSDRIRPVKLGTAAVDRKRCLPWSQAIPCLACEEVCPVSPKAITADTIRSSRRGGGALRLGRPVVNSLLCVGCGRCENVCPVEGEAAIRVFSTGESREEPGSAASC